MQNLMQLNESPFAMSNKHRNFQQVSEVVSRMFSGHSLRIGSLTVEEVEAFQDILLRRWVACLVSHACFVCVLQWLENLSSRCVSY